MWSLCGVLLLCRPWMDTNLVLPLTGSSVDRCRVIFDYYLDADALQQAAASSSCDLSNSASNAATTSSSETSEQVPSGPRAAVIRAALQSKFVKDSLASSHQVQVSRLACMASCWKGGSLLLPCRRHRRVTCLMCLLWIHIYQQIPCTTWAQVVAMARCLSDASAVRHGLSGLCRSA